MGGEGFTNLKFLGKLTLQNSFLGVSGAEVQLDICLAAKMRIRTHFSNLFSFAHRTFIPADIDLKTNGVFVYTEYPISLFNLFHCI